MAGDDFDTTVDRLYGGPPDRFIADRDAAAKQARASGDRELADRIKQLRRPTVAAALLNRHRRVGSTAELEKLIDLGEKLRAAQHELDVPAMRSLGGERTARIAAVIDVIASEAGDDLTPGVRDQLGETLTAAVADADAARAVMSGRLVAALQYSGFGEVDLSGAVAIPLPAAAPGARAAQAPDARDHSVDTEEAAAAQAAATAAAQQQLQDALARLASAQATEKSAQEAAALAERALAAARRTAQQASDRATQATAARKAAEEAVAEARSRITAS